MPRPQPKWSEELREQKGFASLTSWFKPPPKPGRPAGSVKARPGPQPQPVAQVCAGSSPQPAWKEQQAPAEPASAGARKESEREAEREARPL